MVSERHWQPALNHLVSRLWKSNLCSKRNTRERGQLLYACRVFCAKEFTSHPTATRRKSQLAADTLHGDALRQSRSYVPQHPRYSSSPHMLLSAESFTYVDLHPIPADADAWFCQFQISIPPAPSSSQKSLYGSRDDTSA